MLICKYYDVKILCTIFIYRYPTMKDDCEHLRPISWNLKNREEKQWKK